MGDGNSMFPTTPEIDLDNQMHHFGDSFGDSWAHLLGDGKNMVEMKPKFGTRANSHLCLNDIWVFGRHRGIDLDSVGPHLSDGLGTHGSTSLEMVKTS